MVAMDKSTTLDDLVRTTLTRRRVKATERIAAMAAHHGIPLDEFLQLSWLHVVTLERARPTPKESA
jgi:hypothetical protein